MAERTKGMTEGNGLSGTIEESGLRDYLLDAI
jgi:hypothetical protein